MTETCNGNGEHTLIWRAPDGTDYIAKHATAADTFALLPCLDYTVWLDMDGASLKRAGSMLALSDTPYVCPFDIFDASGQFIRVAVDTREGLEIIHINRGGL